MTAPGLSGVLMTQLTWGANAMDAFLAQAAAGDSDNAAAANDSHGGKEGLVGSTKIAAAAMPRDLDHVSDTAEPGVGAESSGVATAAGAVEGRRDEGAKGDGVGGSRRMTFTEVRTERDCDLVPPEHRYSLLDIDMDT